MKIVHLTSVHTRTDTRIFLKMCRSIVEAGHEAVLVVADGLGDSVADGVEIRDVGRASGRLGRMTASAFRVFRASRGIRADIYHLHDPELIPFGLALRVEGRVVVFDAHEDLPKQLLTKPYLARSLARVLGACFAAFERIAFPMLSGLVAATPSIASKLASIHPRTVAVNNFPLLAELAPADGWSAKRNEIAYVGALTRIRGAVQIVKAMANTRSDVLLNFAGAVSESQLENELEASEGWSRVKVHGQLDRRGVRTLLGRSMAGVVTFLDAPNHLDAQPNKMFEYMSAGIPVIASDFPLWRKIIDESECGICVDPADPHAIARAIDAIVADPLEAMAMGERGRAAVLSRYNWQREEVSLLNFYSVLLTRKSA